MFPTNFAIELLAYYVVPIMYLIFCNIPEDVLALTPKLLYIVCTAFAVSKVTSFKDLIVE
jgi:hypothetical protein